MRTILTGGTVVRVREILPSDKRSLAEGLTRLSAESIRRRFLGLRRRFSVAELRYLTEVDGLDHYALVAACEGLPDELIAVARLVRLPSDRAAAEAAIVVCDAYQGRGLGTFLGVALADGARERGIARIEASLTSDNRAALALMRTIAARLTDGGHSNGVHELSAELSPL